MFIIICNPFTSISGRKRNVIHPEYLQAKIDVTYEREDIKLKEKINVLKNYGKLLTINTCVFGNQNV
jgi:hypothetical protein